MFSVLKKLVAAVLGFFGCLAIACMFGAAISGMAPSTALSFLGAGIILLTPAAFSSRALSPAPRSAAPTQPTRLETASLAAIGLGVLLWLTPYLALRSSGSAYRADTYVIVLVLGSASLGVGYLLRFIAARRARQHSPSP